MQKTTTTQTNKQQQQNKYLVNDTLNTFSSMVIPERNVSDKNQWLLGRDRSQIYHTSSQNLHHWVTAEPHIKKRT